MQNLENCPSCGKLFIKSLRSVCQNCHKEIEEKFKKVYTFIKTRKNRMATMEEVEEGTGVSKQDIIRFIKEGRLHLNEFPNLAYPCESCGKEIREGRICNSCRGHISTGIKAQEREKERREREREKERFRNKAYHSLDERLK